MLSIVFFASVISSINALAKPIGFVSESSLKFPGGTNIGTAGSTLQCTAPNAINKIHITRISFLIIHFIVFSSYT